MTSACQEGASGTKRPETHKSGKQKPSTIDNQSDQGDRARGKARSSSLQTAKERISKIEKEALLDHGKGLETLKSVDDEKFEELEQIAEISDFEQPEKDSRICKACGYYGCHGECQ